MDLGTTITLVLVCILVEAFFSGCEIGMISINRFKMEQRAKEGSTSARMILDLIGNPDRLFATTSMGTNVAVVCASAVFTGYMITHFDEWGDFISMLIISPIILFGGEIIPKVIFQNRADSIMQFFIHPLNLFCRVMSPVLHLFSVAYNLFLRLVLRGAHKVNLTPVSREQIRYISHPDSLTSELDIDEKKMIHRIFNFGELRVEQVMVPLIQTYAISDTATIREANHIANETGYSRLPVFHERMFNLMGILNTFDEIQEARYHSALHTNPQSASKILVLHPGLSLCVCPPAYLGRENHRELPPHVLQYPDFLPTRVRRAAAHRILNESQKFPLRLRLD